MIEVTVPPLPESVSDAVILSWQKQPGDAVGLGDTLLELETDKVVLDVPAPANGTLVEHKRAAGDSVKAGDLLALLDERGERIGGGAPPPASEATPAPPAAPAPASEEPSGDASPPPPSPAVRRLIKELNLDPTHIPGSGKHGRVLKSDVMRYLDEHEPDEARHDDELAAIASAQPTAPARTERRVPMTRLRQRIAERLVEAQRNAAILTTFNEVDMQAVIDLRKQYREAFEQRHGIRLGFMSFFVKASIEALKRFPAINASVDGNDVLYHDYYDIGVAVGSPRGLVVPVIRDADRLGFAEIEKTIARFAKQAADGSLGYEDLTGGTFTISNGGIYGSMLSTPILNPPQSGILGMHNITERPVARDGEVVIRPIMYLALSYDHRLVDGQEAVRFLVTIKQFLESPARLLLDL